MSINVRPKGWMQVRSGRCSELQHYRTLTWSLTRVSQSVSQSVLVLPGLCLGWGGEALGGFGDVCRGGCNGGK